MMADPVFEIFREEAREHLQGLEQGFLDLEAAGTLHERAARIDALFRHAHSLKGDARAIGLGDLQQAAQTLENVLDDLRENPETVDRSIVTQGLAQLDQVRQAFEAWQQSGESELLPSQGEASGAALETPPADPVADRGIPAESGGDESRTTTPALPVPLAEESFTVRVPSDRLDRMLTLAGEIRIAQRAGGVLSERMADLRDDLHRLRKSFREQTAAECLPALETALDQVLRIETGLRTARTREQLLVEGLEADIRQARLLPLIMLTDSLRRAVRDLAQSLGKTIQYRVDVGQILLDKAVIEALREPLLHLVRNACDHGLEPAAERRAAGKPPEGSICIRAARRGGRIRITVSDDGRGIDYGRVRERLRRSGRLTETELGQLTDAELAKYLFQPGFSTAEAGHVSGRGVGLDVVLDTVRRLQGSAVLEASSAAGATFALTVPVTVSTIRVLTVSSHGQYYGVPSSAVVRTGRAKRDELREWGEGLVLPVEGQPVRWVHLADLLEIPVSRPTTGVDAWSYLLIAHEGRFAAVAVDDLDEEAEVLLKPLGFPLKGLPGIIGGTVRPDGSVQLVLDLTVSAFGRLAGRTATGTAARRDRPPTAQAEPIAHILVVDDSPTTRAILKNVFSAAGYAVRTATDGVDALERLRSGATDLVVTDVEMPRLNGFDLTRQIKARFSLPVILVTGRESESHRREGLAAGADAYVVKSTFEGQGLLEIVKQFV
jgi:two-component system, chemotaxis family, sensor kinase CheA